MLYQMDSLEDLDDDGFYEDVDKINEESVFFGNFADDLHKLAVKYIQSYFKNKELFCGGPISEKSILTPKYITKVLNTSFSNAIAAAYESLEFWDGLDWISDKDADIEFMIELIHNVEREIPRPFVGGILLMHLEFIYGVEF